MATTKSTSRPTGKKGTTKRKAGSESQALRIPKISWVVKPQGMTLKEWQQALRKQIAKEEPMAVAAVDEKNLPGEYEVRNPQSKQTYKVVYRGEGSMWNYCSCLDFKTSRLGTCKHIESVKLWIDETRRRKVHKEPPAYTSVYLSYTEGRQVKIRVGSDHREEFMQLAAHYFDAEGVMFPYAFDDYDKLMAEAVAIDPSFRFYQDAIDYILEQRERKFRSQLIRKYTDQRLDQLPLPEGGHPLRLRAWPHDYRRRYGPWKDHSGHRHGRTAAARGFGRADTHRLSYVAEIPVAAGDRAVLKGQRSLAGASSDACHRG